MKRMFSYLSARDVSNLPKAVPSLVFSSSRYQVAKPAGGLLYGLE